MKIASKTKLNRCYWVDAGRLEHYWQGDSRLIDDWCIQNDSRDPEKRMPHNGWFQYTNTAERAAFIVPSLTWNNGVGSNKITFDNGRHRFRWMMNYGLKEIPVSIPNEEVSLLSNLGLVIREIGNDEVLPDILVQAINSKYESLNALEV